MPSMSRSSSGSIPVARAGRSALTADQVSAYRKDGILHPLKALSAAEAHAHAQRYLAHADVIKGRNNQKPHLLYTWANEIVRNECILDQVESLLGPDLLCWSAQFFVKPAGDPSYVSWHQDATYWGLSAPDVVTAWVALTPSTRRAGCMQVIPGTQHAQVKHEDRFDDLNLLSRGQEIAVDVDLGAAVDVELQPGQMSLHHVLLFHGSEPNRSDQPRIGFAIRYVPTSIRQRSPSRDSALLVRGSDAYGHFDAETSPRVDCDPEAVACHASAIDRQLRILYEGAQQRGRLNPARRGA